MASSREVFESQCCELQFLGTLENKVYIPYALFTGMRAEMQKLQIPFYHVDDGDVYADRALMESQASVLQPKIQERMRDLIHNTDWVKGSQESFEDVLALMQLSFASFLSH